MGQPDEIQAALRSLPSVDSLLAAMPDMYQQAVSRDILLGVVQLAQAEARSRIIEGEIDAARSISTSISTRLEALVRPNRPPLINGTGVIVHTNLGRSPVSAEAAQAMAEAASNYLPLEFDIKRGERGSRGSEISELMRALTGAERTLVVNNNAAAVMLTLAATSAGRSVVVSRGELVEIGGGFRVPDVLRGSGAILREVGTTNRTYVRDFAAAIDDQTAALLKVHASNFALIGFVAGVGVEELSQLAHASGVLAIEDAGSGCLLDLQAFGLSGEPLLGESIQAGADVVTASGDKLVGGPQAGLILGKAAVVDQIARHPLARALRVDKTVQAGMAATLRHYLRGEATERIPVWWMISRSPEWTRDRVERWLTALDDARAACVPSEAVVGGGSLPGRALPSWALALRDPARPADVLARQLRFATPGVIPRVVDDQVMIDARTILQGQDEPLLDVLRGVLGGRENGELR